MTIPIRLIVFGPGALEFPSRRVTVEGDPIAPPASKWAKKRQRLSVDPGEYTLPLLPGSRLIVDPENNWGVNGRTVCCDPFMPCPIWFAMWSKIN